MVMVTKINVFALYDLPLELKLKHNKYAGENTRQMSASKCKSKMIYGTIIKMDVQKHNKDNTFTK